MNKFRVHVLDSDSARRAKLARSLIGNGVHAEIYESMNELCTRPLESGVIFAHDRTLSSASGTCEVAKLVAKIGLPVSVYSEEPQLARAVRAMLEGAIDYLSWPISPEKLDEFIVNAEALQSIRLREMLDRSAAAEAVSTLSKREREVLKLVVDGHSNKSAAKVLGISNRTVEIHRGKAFQKINARSVAEAVRIGLNAGLQHQFL